MVDADEQPGVSAGDQPTRLPAAQAPLLAPASAAAARWLQEHGDLLWRFALSRTRSRDAAEEIVQETLLAAMQGVHAFTGASTERTWLLGIAAHKIADHFRRARRAGSVESHEAHPAPDHDALFTASGMWSKLPGNWGSAGTTENADLLDALRSCLDKLPPALAEAVWLRDLLGVPTAEVCKALNLTPTNLWTRTFRARAALRLCVEAATNPPPKEPAK